MCAALRALSVVACVGAACLAVTAARAQVPGIPKSDGAAAPGAPGLAVAPSSPAPSGEVAASAPSSTPLPEPAFTAKAPEVAPTPSVASAAPPPSYVAPAYLAPAVTTPPQPSLPASGAPADPKPTPHADDPRWNDAHVDRVVLLPTGETHPSGTTYLSSYDIVGLQAGHALSDRVQLTVSFVPAVFSKDPIVPLDLTLKGVVVRSRRVRVAAMTSATGILGLDSGAAFLGRVGGSAQLCFDDACTSSLTIGASAVFAGQVLLLMDGVGAIVHVAPHMAFLAELQTVLPIARDGGTDNALAGALGLRFAGKRAAIDVALEGPLDRRTKPQAVPLIVGTYRFMP